jgi:hypothetical protein
LFSSITYLPLNRSAIHCLIEGYGDRLIDRHARCSISGITELTVCADPIVNATALAVMPELVTLMLTAPSTAATAIWVLLVTFVLVAVISAPLTLNVARVEKLLPSLFSATWRFLRPTCRRPSDE